MIHLLFNKNLYLYAFCAIDFFMLHAVSTPMGKCLGHFMSDVNTVCDMGASNLCRLKKVVFIPQDATLTGNTNTCIMGYCTRKKPIIV